MINFVSSELLTFVKSIELIICFPHSGIFLFRYILRYGVFCVIDISNFWCFFMHPNTVEFFNYIFNDAWSCSENKGRRFWNYRDDPWLQTQKWPSHVLRGFDPPPEFWLEAKFCDESPFGKSWNDVHAENPFLKTQKKFRRSFSESLSNPWVSSGFHDDSFILGSLEINSTI